MNKKKKKKQKVKEKGRKRKHWAFNLYNFYYQEFCSSCVMYQNKFQTPVLCLIYKLF